MIYIIMESVINEKIKDLIGLLGLTPNSFASKLNMRSTVIYNILNSRNKPSFDLIIDIITTFDVNPRWILGNEEEVFNKKNRENDSFDEKSINVQPHKAINEKFKDLIEALGLTPNSFASKLNMRSTVIYNILNSRNKPSYDLIKNIITTFNVNPQWLLGDGTSIFQQETDIHCSGKLDKNIEEYVLPSFSERMTYKSILELKQKQILERYLDEYEELEGIYNSYSSLVDFLHNSNNVPKLLINQFPKCIPFDEYINDALPIDDYKESEQTKKEFLAITYIKLRKKKRETLYRLQYLISAISMNSDLLYFKDEDN